MYRIVDVVEEAGAMLMLIDHPPRLIHHGEVVAAQVGALAARHQTLRGEDDSSRYRR